MNSQDVVDFVRARLAKGMTPASICEQVNFEEAFSLLIS
jgi:hypothetical protein